MKEKKTNGKIAKRVISSLMAVAMTFSTLSGGLEEALKQLKLEKAAQAVTQLVDKSTLTAEAATTAKLSSSQKGLPSHNNTSTTAYGVTGRNHSYKGLDSSYSVFCADINKSARFDHNYTLYTLANNKKISLTSEQQEAIGLASYYGYPFTNDNWHTFCATQAIIWDIIEGRLTTDFIPNGKSRLYVYKNDSYNSDKMDGSNYEFNKGEFHKQLLSDQYHAICQRCKAHTSLAVASDITYTLTYRNYGTYTGKYIGTVKYPKNTNAGTAIKNAGLTIVSSTTSGNVVTATVTSGAISGTKTISATKTIAKPSDFDSTAYKRWQSLRTWDISTDDEAQPFIAYANAPDVPWKLKVKTETPSFGGLGAEKTWTSNGVKVTSLSDLAKYNAQLRFRLRVQGTQNYVLLAKDTKYGDGNYKFVTISTHNFNNVTYDRGDGYGVRVSNGQYLEGNGNVNTITPNSNGILCIRGLPVDNGGHGGKYVLEEVVRGDGGFEYACNGNSSAYLTQAQFAKNLKVFYPADWTPTGRVNAYGDIVIQDKTFTVTAGSLPSNNENTYNNTKYTEPTVYSASVHKSWDGGGQYGAYNSIYFTAHIYVNGQKWYLKNATRSGTTSITYTVANETAKGTNYGGLKANNWTTDESKALHLEILGSGNSTTVANISTSYNGKAQNNIVYFTEHLKPDTEEGFDNHVYVYEVQGGEKAASANGTADFDNSSSLQLKLHKICNENADSKPVAGASYDLYWTTGAYPTTGGKNFTARNIDHLWYSGVTDEEGNISLPDSKKISYFQLMNFRWFWIERDCPDDFLINTNVIQVNTNNYKTNLITIPLAKQLKSDGLTTNTTDTKKQGQLCITKFGHNGRVLSGIRFNVILDLPEEYTYEFSNPIPGSNDYFYLGAKKNGDILKTIVTDSSGDAEFTGIPLAYCKETGKYTIRVRLEEADENEPYVTLSDSQQITIDSENYSDSMSPNYYTVQTSVTNTIQKGMLTIKKVDKNTEQPLEGAEFKIEVAEDYVVNGTTIQHAGDVIAENLTTNSDGEAYSWTEKEGAADFDRLPLYVGAKYLVTETKAPKGYELSDEDSQPVEFAWDSTEDMFYVEKTIQFEDEPKSVSVNIHKHPEGKDDEWLGGAEFELRANDTVTVKMPDDSVKTFTKGQTIAYAKTIETGTNKGTSLFYNSKANAQIRDEDHEVKLPIGHTYQVVETDPPEGFMLDPTPQILNIGVNTTAEYVIHKAYDAPAGVKVKVIKRDANNNAKPVAGAEFTVFADEDMVLLDEVTEVKKGQSTGVILTTGTNGEAISMGTLPAGKKFIIKETKMPNGYLAPSNNEVSFTTTELITTEIPVMEFTFDEPHQPLNVSVYKYDAELKALDKEFPVKGAEIGLYANEANVLSADGSKTYAKNQLIQSVTTGADGKAEFAEVRSGYSYYVQEITPPEGWVLNENKYVLDNNYDATLNAVSKEVKIDETMKSVSVNIDRKLTDKGDTLAGAEFTLYAAENIFYADGTTVRYAKDTAIDVVTTNANGTGTFSKEVPVNGKYYVKETKVPEGYVSVNTENDIWNFTISNDYANDEISSGDIINKEQVGEITIVKVSDDGAPLEGAEFELIATDNVSVKMPDGDYRDFTANETIGYGKSGTDGKAGFYDSKDNINNADHKIWLPVGHSYTVKETKAPNKYVKANATKTIPLSYDATVEYVSVEEPFTNKWQQGEITVYKKTKFTKGNEEMEVFLKGAEFKLTAVEDVRLASGSILYSAGQEIQTLTTDENGKLTFKLVPVGFKYKIEETKAPKGYVNTHESYEFELEYAAEFEFAATEKVIYNTVQPAKITIEKKDGRTGERLPEAEFKLVAVEDVKYADGTVMYSAGTEIETVKTVNETDSDKATATFKDVPAGYKYKIVESKAPEGYKNTHPEVEFDAAYDETLEYVPVNKLVNNMPIYVSFSKAKLSDSTELAGAKLQIIDKATNTVKYEWTSDGSVHTIYQFPAGSYTFKEVGSPQGYVIATSIDFTVDELGNVTSSDAEVRTYDDNGEVSPLLVMRDDSTKVNITKTDAETDENLAGAVLQLFDKNNNKVDEWTTTTEAYSFIARLTAGETYRIHEVKPPVGYVLRSNDVTFTVPTTGIAKDVEVDNEQNELDVSKKKITDGTELEGATLQIISKADNKVKYEWISDGTVHVIKKIPAGDYKLVETGAPDGYLIANAVDFTIDENNKVTSVEMIDDVNRIAINKIDRDTNAPVTGATLELTINNGKSLSDIIVKAPDGMESQLKQTASKITWVSGANAIILKKLPDGVYTISETNAIAGYAVNTTPVTFTVTKGVITNGSATIDSLNFYNGKSKVNVNKAYKFMIAPAVTGAEFTLTADVDVTWSDLTLEGLENVTYDGNRKMVFKSAAPSGDTEYTMTIVGLPNGNYTIAETAAPEGFLKDENIHRFSVEDGYFVYNGVKYDGNDEGSVDIDDNEYSEFSVLKVDENGIALSGAVLALYDADGNELDRWTTDGTARVFKGLEFGTYTVKELKAPNGFNTAKDLVIEHKGENNGYTFNVVNHRGIVMPQTGGNGTEALMFIGTMLMIAGLLYQLKKRKA